MGPFSAGGGSSVRPQPRGRALSQEAAARQTHLCSSDPVLPTTKGLGQMGCHGSRHHKAIFRDRRQGSLWAGPTGTWLRLTVCLSSCLLVPLLGALDQNFTRSSPRCPRVISQDSHPHSSRKALLFSVVWKGTCSQVEANV